MQPLPLRKSENPKSKPQRHQISFSLASEIRENWKFKIRDERNITKTTYM